MCFSGFPFFFPFPFRSLPEVNGLILAQSGTYFGGRIIWHSQKTTGCRKHQVAGSLKKLCLSKALPFRKSKLELLRLLAKVLTLIPKCRSGSLFVRRVQIGIGSIFSLRLETGLSYKAWFFTPLRIRSRSGDLCRGSIEGERCKSTT